MIEGGWPFVWTAYALTMGSLLVLAAIVIVRLRKWAAEAKKLR